MTCACWSVCLDWNHTFLLESLGFSRVFGILQVSQVLVVLCVSPRLPHTVDILQAGMLQTTFTSAHLPYQQQQELIKNQGFPAPPCTLWGQETTYKVRGVPLQRHAGLSNWPRQDASCIQHSCSRYSSPPPQNACVGRFAKPSATTQL
jgi:hypothetical protein